MGSKGPEKHRDYPKGKLKTMEGVGWEKEIERNDSTSWVVLSVGEWFQGRLKLPAGRGEWKFQSARDSQPVTLAQAEGWGTPSGWQA